MNIKTLIDNVKVAFLAQGTALLLSFLTSLLVPKVLGVEQFGYWQLFLFYSAYVGLFHLGLNDGVYLIHGGIGRDDIDKRCLNSQFCVGMGMQIVFSLVLTAVAFFGPFDQDRCFVIVSTGVMVILNNSTSFLSYLFQAMNETKRSSYTLLVSKLVFLAFLGILVCFRVADFRLYVGSFIVSHIVSFSYCLHYARDIVTAGHLPVPEAVSQSIQSIKVGIKLTIANLASMLILGIARACIDGAWGIETFGELSLSLSLVNFFLLFISQVSMVLFPALRQSNRQEQWKVFVGLRNAISIAMPAVLLLCFPIIWAASMWLPAYAGSFGYFVILFPLCLFDGKMNLVYTTYFKVCRMEKTLMGINLFATGLSAVGALLGVFVLQSPFCVILSAVVSIMARSVVSDIVLSNKMGCSNAVLLVSEVVLAIVFLVGASLLSSIASSAVYFAAYCCYLAINRSETHYVAGKLRKIVKMR